MSSISPSDGANLVDVSLTLLAPRSCRGCSVCPPNLQPAQIVPTHFWQRISQLPSRKICEPLSSHMQLRAWIGIAVVVGIGLISSVAAMSKLVPVDGSEMRSAAISPLVGDKLW